MTRTGAQREVEIRIEGNCLRGELGIAGVACGIVIFAHGSGSGRKSPRNRYVAERLNHYGISTLLFDLLTEQEELDDARTGHLRFDIGLLSDRLSGATDWLKADSSLSGLPVGYFGASTGAAAALSASVRHPSVVRAVVSRGGRPDLAKDALSKVVAPTLLIVGGRDDLVLQLNRQALERMIAEAHLEVVSEATHLFEEPGALDRVADLAAGWFRRYLCEA